MLKAVCTFHTAAGFWATGAHGGVPQAARKEKTLLIEDKTQEQQSPAPSKPKRGQKLRSLWAQLQCIGLLHRHRLRRKTQSHVSDLSRKLSSNPA